MQPADGIAVLSAAGIRKRFGALVVLDDVDFALGPREAVGIVGPNGAGKTTLLSVLSGFLAPNAGTVSFQGRDVTGRGAAQLSRLGIARAHQSPRPFGGMTVFENVFVAAAAGGGLRRAEAYPRCIEALDACGMLAVANRRAETLGLLDRKRLELSRALATQPVALLLDEIGAGLTDGEAHLLVETIRELHARRAVDRLDRARRARAGAGGRTPRVHGFRSCDRGRRAGCRHGRRRGRRRVSRDRGGVTLLSVEQLEARHGFLRAVRGVSFEVAAGETLAIVGANGAGKSTLLRAIAGAHKPAAGRIVFDGRDITALSAHRRVREGIALVPEGRRLFTGMTLEENLLVARRRARPGPWDVEAVLEAFPLLAARRKSRAGNLSGGEQQATAIGRALMTNPRLLLLDEVSLGLAPVAVDGVYRALRGLIETGATIVLVEQDLNRALEVATRVACMLEGEIVLEGPAAEMTREQVVEAYFGLGRPEGETAVPA